MLNQLIRFSLGHRSLIIGAAALLLLVGGVWTAGMPVDVFPDLTAPTVTVITEGRNKNKDSIMFDLPEALGPIITVVFLEKSIVLSLKLLKFVKRNFPIIICCLAYNTLIWLIYYHLYLL